MSIHSTSPHGVASRKTIFRVNINETVNLFCYSPKKPTAFVTFNCFTARPFVQKWAYDGFSVRSFSVVSVHQLTATATPEYRCFAYGVINEKKKKWNGRRETLERKTEDVT
jgi:hypothetical protein